MTPERFHQIVEAYGADPRRWPSAERAAGQAWAQRHRQQRIAPKGSTILTVLAIALTCVRTLTYGCAIHKKTVG